MTRTMISRTIAWLAMALGAGALAVACGAGDAGPRATATLVPDVSTAVSTAAPATGTAAGTGAGFTLTSSAFANNAPIPREYSCDGASTSPPLAWSGAPPGTMYFALIVDDPDAPVQGGFTHWVAYDIPASAGGLAPAVAVGVELPAGGKQGKNGAGGAGYTGPCPPPGDAPHHYLFHLYALDAPLGLSAGATKTDVLATMQGHARGEAGLVGLYGR